MNPSRPHAVSVFVFEAGGTLLGADPREIRAVTGGGGGERRALRVESPQGERTVAVDRVRGIEILGPGDLRPLPEWAEPLRARGILGAALAGRERPVEEREVVLLVSLGRFAATRGEEGGVA